MEITVIQQTIGLYNVYINMLYVHSVFIFIFSVLYSILEIEIEGKDGGWAKNIPTVPSGLGILTNYHFIMNIIWPLELKK